MSGMNVVSCSEEGWRLQRAGQYRAPPFIIHDKSRLGGNRCHRFRVTKGMDANRCNCVLQSIRRQNFDVPPRQRPLVSQLCVAPLEGIEPPSRP